MEFAENSKKALALLEKRTEHENDDEKQVRLFQLIFHLKNP